MKRIMITVIAALALSFAFAEGKPHRPSGSGPKGEEMHQAQGERHSMMMMHAGPWVARMMSNKANLEKIGITDEEMLKKVLSPLLKLKEKGDDLEKKVREVSREQAQMMREMFEGREIEEKEVFGKINEVAKLRAEQGKLSVKAILVLRENLSKEQLEKARALIFERGRERGQMRRGGGRGHSAERREPPADVKRKKPPKED